MRGGGEGAKASAALVEKAEATGRQGPRLNAGLGRPERGVDAASAAEGASGVRLQAGAQERPWPGQPGSGQTWRPLEPCTESSGGERATGRGQGPSLRPETLRGGTEV